MPSTIAQLFISYMIRILLDEIGDSHHDIFLKVDAIPSFVQVADTHFLGAFLSEDFETKSAVTLAYLNYFLDKIQGLEHDTDFIPFDLSDQYVGGLFVSTKPKGLVKVEYAWTDQISGWEITRASTALRVNENQEGFKLDRDWLLPKEALVAGLVWSINRMKKTCDQDQVT
ncbi:hypothetical protein [Pontibacter sp. G13]|uniref:hypothetical protein n=1 Tax=Pontibacter sp. G13 TaxID=3074898 RepID=UPI0028895460|nr:hypothetical protein [Pontibacter sp. G13]WNJ20356.1 hypothetical protein RJD25_07735 [Pontibacter sp. G13]